MFARKRNQVLNDDWTAVAPGFEVKLFSSINEVNAGKWNALNRTRNIFTTHDFLGEMERTAPAEMGFCYALLRKEEKVIAGYIFQTLHLRAEVLSEILSPVTAQKAIISGLGEWLTKCKEEKGMRVLISGNNFISGEHGVIFADHADHSDVFAKLSDIVNLIVKRNSDPVRFSVILVKDYYEKEKLLSPDVLKKKRFHRFAVEPEMILPLSEEWKAFDAYLEAMSKKYRNRAKSVMKKSEILVMKNLSAGEIEAQIKELYPLYRHLHDKARFRLAPLTEQYFFQMKTRFPEHYFFKVYYCDNKPVAFRTQFINGKQLEAHFVGIDSSVNRELCLYQRLLYDFVTDAIELKSDELMLGRTAAEIKSTIGAVPHALTCYIRHRNSISNHIIGPFIDYLKPSEWTPRSPFKENN